MGNGCLRRRRRYDESSERLLKVENRLPLSSPEIVEFIFCDEDIAVLCVKVQEASCGIALAIDGTTRLLASTSNISVVTDRHELLPVSSMKAGKNPTAFRTLRDGNHEDVWALRFLVPATASSIRVRAIGFDGYSPWTPSLRLSLARDISESHSRLLLSPAMAETLAQSRKVLEEAWFQQLRLPPSLTLFPFLPPSPPSIRKFRLGGRGEVFLVIETSHMKPAWRDVPGEKVSKRTPRRRNNEDSEEGEARKLWCPAPSLAYELRANKKTIARIKGPRQWNAVLRLVVVGCQPGKSYRFDVCGLNKNGKGNFSSPAKLTFPTDGVATSMFALETSRSEPSRSREEVPLAQPVSTKARKDDPALSTTLLSAGGREWEAFCLIGSDAGPAIVSPDAKTEAEFREAALSFAASSKGEDVAGAIQAYERGEDSIIVNGRASREPRSQSAIDVNESNGASRKQENGIKESLSAVEDGRSRCSDVQRHENNLPGASSEDPRSQAVALTADSITTMVEEKKSPQLQPSQRVSASPKSGPFARWRKKGKQDREKNNNAKNKSANQKEVMGNSGLQTANNFGAINGDSFATTWTVTKPLPISSKDEFSRASVSSPPQSLFTVAGESHQGTVPHVLADPAVYDKATEKTPDEAQSSSKGNDVVVEKGAEKSTLPAVDGGIQQNQAGIDVKVFLPLFVWPRKPGESRVEVTLRFVSDEGEFSCHTLSTTTNRAGLQLRESANAETVAESEVQLLRSAKTASCSAFFPVPLGGEMCVIVEVEERNEVYRGRSMFDPLRSVPIVVTLLSNRRLSSSRPTDHGSPMVALVAHATGVRNGGFDPSVDQSHGEISPIASLPFSVPSTPSFTVWPTQFSFRRGLEVLLFCVCAALGMPQARLWDVDWKSLHLRSIASMRDGYSREIPCRDSRLRALVSSVPMGLFASSQSEEGRTFFRQDSRMDSLEATLPVLLCPIYHPEDRKARRDPNFGHKNEETAEVSSTKQGAAIALLELSGSFYSTRTAAQISRLQEALAKLMTGGGESLSDKFLQYLSEFKTTPFLSGGGLPSTATLSLLQPAFAMLERILSAVTQGGYRMENGAEFLTSLSRAAAIANKMVTSVGSQ